MLQRALRRQVAGLEQVAERLAPHQAWELSTVKTLLNRLLKKRAVAARTVTGATRP